jgi:histidine phosphotransferase ChpT
MADEYDLGALIGSRLCHDLISPLGAIANGVELLQMDGGNAGPEIALIAESVASANARIRFFRVAFGAGSGGQRFGRSDLVAIVSDWCANSRLRVTWRAPGDQSRNEVKLVFLALQCIESALPRGGEVSIEHDSAAWEIVITAAQVRRDPDLWAMLSDHALRPPLAAAQVQFGLLQDLLCRQRRRIEVREDSDGFTVRLA